MKAKYESEVIVDGIRGHVEHWSLLVGLLIMILEFPLQNVYAQSNEELLEAIKRMRAQIEVQQKQLQIMEEHLQQQNQKGQDKAQAFSNPLAISPPNDPVVIAEPPRTDSYLAGFVGGALTSRTSVLLDRRDPFFESVNKAKGVSINTSPIVGGKAGLCPHFFLNVCSELEFEHFRPNIDEQQARGTVINSGGVAEPAFVSNVDLRVWDLGLSAVGRFGFFSSPGYPLAKRLHFYLGAGPSFVWTEARSGSTPTAGKEDSKFAVGVHAITGLKYFITQNLAVFGEYKFKHWEPNGFNLGSDRFEPGSFNSHLFYMGLALHP